MTDLSTVHRTCFSPRHRAPQLPMPTLPTRPPSEHRKPAALVARHPPPQPREMLSSPGNLFIIRPILLLADWSPVQRKVAGKSLCRQQDGGFLLTHRGKLCSHPLPCLGPRIGLGSTLCSLAYRFPLKALKMGSDVLWALLTHSPLM